MRLLAAHPAEMEEVADCAVAIARALGADHAVASARASAGVRVTAREGATDTALRDARQGLTLTVYRGARAGTASTAALDAAAVRRAAEEAFALAGRVSEDPEGLPPDLDQMAVDTPSPPLDAPADLDISALRAMALRGDALIRAARPGPGIGVETVAAGASSSEVATAMATSTGFRRGQLATVHNIWAVALARDASGAANDSAESVDRRFNALDSIETLAARAAEGAAGRLGARAVVTHTGPVIFEARVATALVGALVAALSGASQNRGATFLPGVLGQAAAAEHLDLTEDPSEPYGLASGAFDSEGVAGRRRAILNAGVVEGYFLRTRSARQLGMVSTGNADGPWNLRLSSRAPGGSLDALRRLMGRGLVVTRLMGGAADPITGNWTYAVAGSWIENGETVHAVTDVTVGGNLKDMLRAIVAVGDDTHRAGAIRTGSILIDGLRIGGLG